MEAQYFYGPPLLNAQVAAMRAGRELFITTFDRDRKVGAVYRMLGGRAELFAGGTPPAGGPPLLVQPRSEEHTSELQSPCNLVCRLLLEKKKKTKMSTNSTE